MGGLGRAALPTLAPSVQFDVIEIDRTLSTTLTNVRVFYGDFFDLPAWPTANRPYDAIVMDTDDGLRDFRGLRPETYMPWLRPGGAVLLYSGSDSPTRPVLTVTFDRPKVIDER